MWPAQPCCWGTQPTQSRRCHWAGPGFPRTGWWARQRWRAWHSSSGSPPRCCSHWGRKGTRGWSGSSSAGGTRGQAAWGVPHRGGSRAGTPRKGRRSSRLSESSKRCGSNRFQPEGRRPSRWGEAATTPAPGPALPPAWRQRLHRQWRSGPLGRRSRACWPWQRCWLSAAHSPRPPPRSPRPARASSGCQRAKGSKDSKGSHRSCSRRRRSQCSLAPLPLHPRSRTAGLRGPCCSLPRRQRREAKECCPRQPGRWRERPCEPREVAPQVQGEAGMGPARFGQTSGTWRSLGLVPCCDIVIMLLCNHTAIRLLTSRTCRAVYVGQQSVYTVYCILHTVQDCIHTPGLSVFPAYIWHCKTNKTRSRAHLQVLHLEKRGVKKAKEKNMWGCVKLGGGGEEVEVSRAV